MSIRTTSGLSPPPAEPRPARLPLADDGHIGLALDERMDALPDEVVVC
jgi:hypothetical protein